MPVLAPLKLTLYNLETYEPTGEFLCNFVPFKYLRLAIELAKSMASINPDGLNGLIVDLFGRQFSVNQLTNGTEAEDRRQLLQAILNRYGLASTSSDVLGEDAYEKPDQDVEQNDARENWIFDLEDGLMKLFGWSLYEINETNIEHLMPFVSRYKPGDAGTSAPSSPEKVYADQVRWF